MYVCMYTGLAMVQLLVIDLLHRRTMFDRRPVRMEFMLNQMALEQVSLLLYRLFLSVLIQQCTIRLSLTSCNLGNWQRRYCFYYWRAPQQMLRTHRSLEGLLCNPMRKMIKMIKMMMIRFFLLFHFNGVPVEWNWQGKAEVLREKPVPVPLCPPQIPHGPTRDRNRASAMRGRRLTSWVMARPDSVVK
jgi:hypothetical protein